MINIEALRENTTPLREIAIPLNIVPGLDDPEQKIIVEINDDIRRKELKIARNHNRLVYRQDSQGAEFVTNKFSYAEEMADLCIRDAHRTFGEKGKDIGYDASSFKLLLLRYPEFLAWFNNALTEAFAETAKLKKDAKEATVKN